MPSTEADTVLADYHTHTEYSQCCVDITMERLRGILPDWPAPIAITDHSGHFVFAESVWRDFYCDEAQALFAARRDEGRERVLRYLERGRALPGPVLIGTELDVFPDGRPAFPEELLGELDIIVGGVHEMASVRHGRPTDEALAEWRLQNRALMGLGAHIIAHPFRYLVEKKMPVRDEDVDWLVAEASARGVALELSANQSCRGLNPKMVRACLQRSVRLATGSDSHAWGRIGKFPYQLALLAECGVVTPEQLEAVLYRHGVSDDKSV